MLDIATRRRDKRPEREAEPAVETERTPDPGLRANVLSRQVATAIGNRAFSALVARQDTATADPAAPAAGGPRTETTDYGTFAVYADDFMGPLPAAEAGAGHVWPVRKAEFARIKIAMNSVSGGAAGVVINGTATFKSAVMLDLAWLLTVSVGRELLDAMVASGKTVTIDATAGGNSTGYANNPDSYERADGTPGSGCNTTVSYNTGEWNPYGGTEAWMRRPPAIGLAHEMIHAWTGMTGTRALGSDGGVSRREQQATGLGTFSVAAMTENRFRAAFGLPQRPRY